LFVPEVEEVREDLQVGLVVEADEVLVVALDKERLPRRCASLGPPRREVASGRRGAWSRRRSEGALEGEDILVEPVKGSVVSLAAQMIMARPPCPVFATRPSAERRRGASRLFRPDVLQPRGSAIRASAVATAGVARTGCRRARPRPRPPARRPRCAWPAPRRRRRCRTPRLAHRLLTAASPDRGEVAGRGRADRSCPSTPSGTIGLW